MRRREGCCLSLLSRLICSFTMVHTTISILIALIFKATMINLVGRLTLCLCENLYKIFLRRITSWDTCTVVCELSDLSKLLSVYAHCPFTGRVS